MASKNKSAAPEEEMELDLMTITDEDGTEVTFEVIDNFKHKGETYLAAVEYVEDEADVSDDSQLILLKVNEDEEGEYLDIVEDDEELLEVSAVLEKRLEGAFEIQN